MIENLIPSASTYSGEIDFVIMLIGVVVGFWFFLTLAMFFWLLWRFRHQPGVPTTYVTGKEPHLKRWINIPHGLIILCDVVIIVAAMRVWYMVKQDLPAADATIRVHAQQWAWSFTHPGLDGELDTADDIKTVDELHIEKGKLYHFKLTAQDVLHSFSVPVFRLKQDAIPGREITGWFEATQTGQYDIQCTEMCGIGHGIMAAQLHIETNEEHAAWIARNTH
jgi:cytochrome c oxidase subunit II